MRKMVALALATAWLLFTLAFSTQQKAASSRAGEKPFPREYLGENDGYAFVIFFTGDVKGNFEPCG